MFVNLTPHIVTIQSVCNETSIEISSSGVCRVNTTSQNTGFVDGVPVISMPIWGDVVGLPDPIPETNYIVSLIVLDALRASGSNRRDCFAPATGPNDGVIRNEKGHIVAVTKLVGL